MRKEQEPAFLTKITRPALSGIFPRNRLFELLDRVRGRPIIWVTGPPGCGKTTLVSSYIEANDIPCLWYQMDKNDADAKTFFYFMRLAAKKTETRNSSRLSVLSSEYLKEVSTVTLWYFESLYNWLKIPSVIVFDDYHEIPGESSFHEVIRNGLSKIPEGINVIMISRNNPPPALIRTCIHQQMEILGYNELRLTLEEVDEIVRLRTHETLLKETVLRLHSMTDGWAAGLVVMLLKAKTEGVEHLLRNRHIPEEIFDYFLCEIFDKTDEDTRNFLLKTAFLPKMNEEIVEKLTGCRDTSRILSGLNRNNQFTEKFFYSEPVYQYHPLFRSFLMQRAKETFPKETLAVICRDTAMLLDEAAQARAAAELLHDVADWNTLTQLITKHAPLALAQGKHHLLEESLNKLPRDIIENTTWLLYWTGACHLPRRPSHARNYFEKAFEKFKEQEDLSGAFLAWSGIVDAIEYDFEGFEKFDKWIHAAEELTNKYGAFPSEDIRSRVVIRMFTALVLRQPEHSEIRTWAKLAISLTENLEDMNAKIHTLFYLALYRMYSGDFEKANLMINALRHLAWSGEKCSPLSRIKAGYAEAWYCYFTGTHENCLKVVSDCLELSRASGIHTMDCKLISMSASSALNANDYKTAEDMLEKMASSSNFHKPWELSQYHWLKSQESLLRRDISQASLHADLALKSGDDVGFPFLMGLYHLTKAYIIHELGKNEDAAGHLAHASDIASRMKSKILKFYISWAEALFSLDQGDEASGLKSLRKAMSIGKRHGYVNILMDQPSVTAKLCAKALDAEIEVDYVRELIRKHNLAPDKTPLHVDNWPWRLKIFALGRFSVVRDGKAVRFSGKAQQKPLSMLKALLAFGGREVREDQIADALWPDADGDMAHRSFATTLHRLRKLLGDHRAVKLRDGRLTLDQRYCWVDVWAFQRTFGQADAAWRKGTARADNKEVIRLAQKAIEIYKGPFLAEENSEYWTFPLRELLRSKFLRGVSKLGQYWEKDGQWGKAAECYQRGLEVDNIAEDFYRRLMICYYRLGLRAEALTVYERCKKMLSMTLGISPSSDTEAICKSLLCEKNS
ncbi:BTAD domain-containing putative transcriptional regulator [Desulfonema magnum]|nr:BTAD domain-containing putative transcriptional regulator [Desulfonema magnum]